RAKCCLPLPAPYASLCISSPITSTITIVIYTLSLHDALPILCVPLLQPVYPGGSERQYRHAEPRRRLSPWGGAHALQRQGGQRRSEEHTSELQSRFDLVCRLLLEKKKQRC